MSSRSPFKKPADRPTAPDGMAHAAPPATDDDDDDDRTRAGRFRSDVVPAAQEICRQSTEPACERAASGAASRRWRARAFRSPSPTAPPSPGRRQQQVAEEKEASERNIQSKIEQGLQLLVLDQ